jgi:hypothetical protein
MSKNVIIKTRTAANVVCLITDPNLCAGHLRCNQPQETGSAPTASTRDVQNQKCPVLLPPSPFGAYDGFGKCASIAVICGSPVPRSVTTPSCGPEAQAESSHAITKANIPHDLAHLFTEPNLLIEQPDATSGIRVLMLRQTSHEKILHGKRSSRLVLHGRQLGRA